MRKGERVAWGMLGLSVGVLGSALMAAPWLAPLADRVVNAMTNVCAAVAAVGGAYLLWTHQLRTREARLKESIVVIFDGLLEDLNLARINLSYDGAQQLMVAEGGQTNDPVEITSYIKSAGKFRLHFVIQRAALAIEQLYSLQDAIAGLSSREVRTLLELHQIASELVRRVPELLEELEAAAGNLYLSSASTAVMDHAVSLLAYHLNEIDSGSRNDELYKHNKWRADAVASLASKMAPEVRLLGLAARAAPEPAEIPAQQD
ncbi:hypothetical protein [Stenotrophomonas sp.]|uniref:hypothetical protein n=1 Tax=Stenotrophomonas sp. TaxID=69392 RepID=UPI0028AACD8E|nr:hypothetical protein [Stenotrophomonas sp.]